MTVHPSAELESSHKIQVDPTTGKYLLVRLRIEADSTLDAHAFENRTPHRYNPGAMDHLWRGVQTALDRATAKPCRVMLVECLWHDVSSPNELFERVARTCADQTLIKLRATRSKSKT